MKAAIDKVLSKKLGYRKAALEHGIPQTTLERYVKKIKRGEEIIVGLPLGPRKSVFSQKEEQELAEYIKHMEERLFGLTTLDLRRLAYQLAVRNNKKHNFSNEKEMAGVDWLNGFLKRNPELSIRKPEATSAARAMGFNRVAVGNFYQLLGETYDALHLTPDRIYNCDETGISVVSKTKSKIIALKGRKQVGSLSSAERGQTVTVEICLNAAGTYMPPLIIFPRQRMKAELLDHAPPGTTSACNPKGWITAEIFTVWFKQFIQFTGVSPSNKVLLLLDGHVSHTQNLDVIDLARQHGVVIICFPPHCTHKLQPADVAFMRPLSTYYDHAASNWLRSHPGRVITMFQISEIFGQAYMQAATMSTAVNGFRKCGIWPYNQDNFSDADFIAAETTNIPLAQDNPSTSRATTHIAPHSGYEMLTQILSTLSQWSQSLVLNLKYRPRQVLQISQYLIPDRKCQQPQMLSTLSQWRQSLVLNLKYHPRQVLQICLQQSQYLIPDMKCQQLQMLLTLSRWRQSLVLHLKYHPRQVLQTSLQQNQHLIPDIKYRPRQALSTLSQWR